MNDPASTIAHGSPQGTGKAVRILHLTDFHFLPGPGQTMLGVDTELSFSEVVAAAGSTGPRPDLALLTGDLVQTPSAAAYRRLKTRLQALECPCYCLPGNHDDPALMAGILAGEKLFCRAQILLRDWQIICLNSVVPGEAHGLLAGEQLATLATLLDAQPGRFALIALHHHPVPCGSRWMDTMVLKNSDAFFAVLERHGNVKAVIFGHIHQAMDCVHRGLRFIGTPSTCFQFEPNRADLGLDSIGPGYRWIELHPDGSITTRLERLETVPEDSTDAAAGDR